MADTYSTNLVLTLMEEGAHSNDWGSYLNENFDTIDEKLGDTTSISTTGGDTTLTSTQEIVATILVSGTLSSAANIIFSGRGGVWCVRNTCAGAYAVTCKVSGQTGVVIPPNTEALIRCNGTDIFFAVRPPAPVSLNTLAPHQNLYVAYASVATLTVSADAVVLFDTTYGMPRRFTSLAASPNIASSGANGLDTGAEASSTWYYLWGIGKDDGTVATLLSVSATAPTMPSGYTHKALLGMVRNNASSNFNPFVQRGEHVTSEVQEALIDGTATAVTSVSLSTIVPPNAKTVMGILRPSSSSGTAAATITVSADSGGVYRGGQAVRPAGLSASSDYVQGTFDQVLQTAQVLYYFVLGANAKGSVYVNGWRY